MKHQISPFLLVSVFVLSGCMTTAAILELPKAASLDPEPPRYFQMSLEVNIEGQKKEIEYTWKCEQEKVFSASVMTWKLRWNSNPRYVVQKQKDGSAIFFFQPPAGYCFEKGERDYFPSFGVIPSHQSLTSVNVYIGRFVGGKHYSEAVLKGKIRRLQGAANLALPSSEESSLANQLQSQSRNFLARSVRIYPQSIWRKYKEPARYYSDILVITKAANMYSPEKKKLIDRSGLYFFPVRVQDFMKDEDHKNMLHFNVEEKNNEITIDGNDIPQEWVTFRNEGASSQDKPVKFCYYGQCVELNGAANEIFDPVTGNVIGISSVSTLSNTFY